MLLQANSGVPQLGQTSGRPPESTATAVAAAAAVLPGAVAQTAAITTVTSNATREGRLYYCNHLTRVASWLPPIEQWGVGEQQNLPYGWEQAVDSHGTPYYINHVNKTTTYEAPIVDGADWTNRDTSDGSSGAEGGGNSTPPPPEPREVTLTRSPELGFGFVAGSEKPVVVRFVTPDGPSVDKLLPGDEILAVNDEDVHDSPRERVIALVRSSTTQVKLLVCQPRPLYSTLLSGPCGRKSTLLSAGKRARLRARPPGPRVRFAESVCVNGAPLFPPSAFSLGEMCAPPMANVLKVFLENGQTKSFKYDAHTTVQDVVSSLQQKLCLSAVEHFSLVVEHVKSLRRNKLTLLDPQDTLARIASRPGAHKLRCLFRVSFVPVSASALAQRDPAALDYLFAQCCNDVAAERFAPELQPEPALRLAALHMHQHALSNNVPPAKLSVKSVEREFGLERFVPPTLMENMKRKEIRRLVSHFLRSYSSLGSGGSSQSSGGKALTPLQAKLLYLDLVSQLPSYGAKCFSAGPPRIATPTDFIERVLLVSPRFGLSQITGNHNSVPVPIARLEDMCAIAVKREDELNCIVEISLVSDRSLHVSLDERDACELALVLQGYHRVLTGKILPVDREREPPAEDLAPPYLAQHSVVPAKWSYIDYETLPLQRATFVPTPKYDNIHTNGFYNSDTIKRANAVNHVKPLNGTFNVDNNMNSSISNKNQINAQKTPLFDYDLQSVVSMEILESGVVESKNEEVIKRVQEMQKLVENSEQYLTEQEKSNHKRSEWQETNLDIESDSDSMLSSFDDAPGQLKHSDSLTLLTQHQKNGTTNGHIDLTALDILRNDLLQSESDTDSLCTPTNSPIRFINNRSVRTSFGLHSPDNNCKNEQDLKEYLRQLRENSNIANVDDLTSLDNDLNIYDLDPDIIDLTLLPPPQTPDELDDLSNISATLNIPPTSFADSPLVNSYRNSFRTNCAVKTVSSDRRNNHMINDNIHTNGVGYANDYDKNLYSNGTVGLDEVDFDEFLASVAVKPPLQQVTPAVELTSEEIMSYIIPPPPDVQEDPKNSTSSSSSLSSNSTIQKYEDNETKNSQASSENNHVIEYSTVDRKGPFSCCGKSKSDKQNQYIKSEKEEEIQPPPRNNGTELKPPDRPPKSNKINDNFERQRSNSLSCDIAPTLPPRDSINGHSAPPHIYLPPKKPPLPPVPSIELRNKIRSPAPILKNRTAGIGSPHLQRNRDQYKDLENGLETSKETNLFTYDLKNTSSEPKRAVSTPTSPHLLRNAKLSTPPIAFDRHIMQSSNNNFESGTLPKNICIGQNVKSNQITEHRRTSSSVEHLFQGCPLKVMDNANESKTDGCPSTDSTGHSRTLSETRQFTFGIPLRSKDNTNNDFRHINTDSTGHLRTFSESRQTTFSSPLRTMNNVNNSKFENLNVDSTGHSRSLSESKHNGSPLRIAENKTGNALNIDSTGHQRSMSESKSQCTPQLRKTLLTKSDVALAGLLVRLDQVAAQCSAAQAHGGGRQMSEERFQAARNELTSQSLQLVTSSKCVVVALSSPASNDLPEHLGSCLSILRRLTELSQDLTAHTTAPLQTRNLILKVHSVTAAFRELISATIEYTSTAQLEEQLAHHAECLANVLATLLRSLRVFSP